MAVAVTCSRSDLVAVHGLYTTAQGLRYTISEPAQRQVLGWLLELNHARYAAEVAAGLHEKKGRGTKGGVRNEGQLGLL